MKRLYYLSDNLDLVEHIADALHHAGISAWDFHVLSKDAEGIYRRHLLSAGTLHRRGIMRGSERGALGGFLLGLAASIMLVVFWRLSPAMSLIAFASVTFVPMLVGSWLGAEIGRLVQGQRLAAFNDDIERGKAVLIIDVDREHFSCAQDLMKQFPALRVHPASLHPLQHLRCA